MKLCLEGKSDGWWDGVSWWFGGWDLGYDMEAREGGVMNVYVMNRENVYLGSHLPFAVLPG